MCVGASRRRVTGVTASCVCNEGCVGAAVMWFGRRRAVRVLRVAGACWAAAWAAPRELAVQARVGTANCIAGGCKGCIRAAERRFCNRFQQRAVWTTQWCCTRARGGRGLRDAELHRLTNERLGCQQVDALGTGSKSLVIWWHSSEAKLIRVPKEAYLKSHPRNTLSSGIDRALCFAAEQDEQRLAVTRR